MKNALTIIFSAFAAALLCLFINRLWLPIILITGLIGLAVVVFAFRKRPEVLLTVCLVLQFIPIGKYISYPSYVALFSYLLVKQYYNSRKTIKLNILHISWLSIILLGCITIYKWIRLFEGLQWFMSLAIIPYILYVLIFEEYISYDGVKWLLSKGIPIVITFIVVAILSASIIILLNQVSSNSSFSLISFRSIVIAGNGNNRLAGFLILCSVYGFLSKVYWKGSRLKNCLFSVVLVAALALSFLFTSRGALISLLTAIIVFVLGKYNLQKKTAPPKIGLPQFVFGAVLATFIFIVMKPFISILIYRMQHIRSYSMYSRLVLWKDCIMKIKDNWIIGTGAGQYPWFGIGELLEDPHNIILRYGVEFGAISIIFLLINLFYPFVIFAKDSFVDRNEARKIYLIFAPPLLGVFVHSLVDSLIGARSMGPFIWLIWIIFIKLLIGYNDNIANNGALSVANI